MKHEDVKIMKHKYMKIMNQEYPVLHALTVVLLIMFRDA